MPRVPAVPGVLRSAPFRGSAAVAAGLLTRRQLAGPTWRRLYPDVYLHRDATLDHLTWCSAAAMVLPAAGALAGRSAAFLYGADVVPLGGAPSGARSERRAPDTGSASVAACVPPGIGLRAPAGLIVWRSELPPTDVVRRGGLPVTTPVRTAFDLARRLDLVDAVVAVDAMLYRRLVTLPTLAAFLAGCGWTVLRFTADDVLRHPDRVLAQVRTLLSA